MNIAKFLRAPILKNICQKQPPRDVSRKRCSENMQQIYRRTPTPKCDFSKVALQYLQDFHKVARIFSVKSQTSQTLYLILEPIL